MTSEEHLPPSPSPSPPKTRQRRKQHDDPWTKLASTPLHSPPPSPKEEPEHQESLLTRIIISPLLFTSFILSLFLINHRDRLRRTHSQSSSSTFLSYFSPSAWIDPEPYQDPSDSTWQLDNSNTSAPDALKPEQAIGKDGGDMSGRKKKGKKGWFFHTKGRAMTKLEVGDAFEMRGRVMVVLMVALAGVVVAGVLGVRWMVGILWER